MLCIYFVDLFAVVLRAQFRRMFDLFNVDSVSAAAELLNRVWRRGPLKTVPELVALRPAEKIGLSGAGTQDVCLDFHSSLREPRLKWGHK